MAFGKNGSVDRQAQNSTASGTMMPIIPTDWAKAYGGAMNALGASGITPAQDAYLGDLDFAKAQQDVYKNAGYYSLQDMSRNWGGEWATPDQISAPTVAAHTGAAFMEPYRQGYTRDVVDSTLANFDRTADRQLNAYRLRQSQAGAFGDRGLLGESQFLSDSDLNRAQTEAALRDQGFTRGAAFGMEDAARDLSAQNTNAGHALAAQTFNNTLANNRQQFSVNQALQGDAHRMQALRDYATTTALQSNIASGGFGQLLNLLGAGTSTFGQQTDGATSSTGKSSSKGGNIGFP